MTGDEEHNRKWALHEICEVDRHGAFEGVEFDLRHELLDPAEWHTWAHIGSNWGELPYGRTVGIPYLWFPWYGEFDKLKVSQVINDEIEEYIKDNGILSKKHIAKLRAEKHSEATPRHFINPGDKVVVDFVEVSSIDHEFSHLHDSQLRFAYCKIIRTNRRIVKIKSPILFVGLTTVKTKISKYNSFDRIVHRMLKHFGVDSLYKLKWDSDSLAYQAADYALGVLSHSKEALKLVRDLDFASPDYFKAHSHWESVNRAVLTGYYWARAEAELAMKPLATSALRVKAGATSGGTKSGKTRQRKRAETWEPIAREMAKSIRAENPTFSQDDVATEIDAGWKATTCDPPGHSTLKGLIWRMEQAGELPKRPRT